MEARLDNVVFRLGIAPTRMAARQLVGHNHIAVNNQVISIPSYTLKAGDTISVREKSKSLETINNCVSATNCNSQWMEFNKATLSGKFISMPEREQIPENIKEQLIVELYSK